MDSVKISWTIVGSTLLSKHRNGNKFWTCPTNVMQSLAVHTIEAYYSDSKVNWTSDSISSIMP